MSNPVHSRPWFRAPSGPMIIFLFFPDFYVFWSVASFSKRGGVCLLLVTAPLLGSDCAGAHFHSLTHSRLSISNRLAPSLYNLGTDNIENTASKNSYIIACLFIVAENYLSSPSQETGDFFWLHYSGFRVSCHNMFTVSYCTVSGTLCQTPA